jgi:hypothetical protein
MAAGMSFGNNMMHPMLEDLAAKRFLAAFLQSALAGIAISLIHRPPKNLSA